jgi:RecJ-like exonuclease
MGIVKFYDPEEARKLGFDAEEPADPAPTEHDWIKSDHCQECDGEGHYTHWTQVFDDYESDKEQCPECERLHALELRADRMMDEAKGD